MRTQQTQMDTSADILSSLKGLLSDLSALSCQIQQGQSGSRRDLAGSQGSTSGEESLLWVE